MREHAYCGGVFPYRSGTYCVCSSVHVPKVHTESNHGVGVHVVTSLVPLMIIWLCCSLLLLSTMLVYMCTCIYILYIGLSWTSVLSASFSSFVPHCHQLSIVGDKDLDRYACICVHTCTVHRAVLDQGFVYLFSSFVPHCHQLSIVGDKDSEFLK